MGDDQKSNGIRIWRDKANTEKLGITKTTESLKGMSQDWPLTRIYYFLHFKDGYLMQIDR